MKLDTTLTNLAADQDGVVTTAQLRVVGISTWQQNRLVADGVIHRIAPRVYALRGSPDTHRRRLRAGLLCLGERSWVSFEAAAALHGLDRSDPRAVEFTIDRGRRPAIVPFVVHTTTRLRPIDQVVVDGLRTMSATRTVFDLALARAHPRRIEAAIDSAVRLHLSSPEVILRRLDRPSRVGPMGLPAGRGDADRCRRPHHARAPIPRTRPRSGSASPSHPSGVPLRRSPRRSRRLPVRPARCRRRGLRPEGPCSAERPAPRRTATK